MLRYIKEMLEKYDVYGLELDFTREYILFPTGFEAYGSRILNEFILNVKCILDTFSEKYSHKIKLSLLLPPSPKVCMEYGFDIVNLVNTADIDCIAILPRWETTDTDMPVELWKALLRGSDAKIGCGQAAANLSRGADFVYLYNYMDCADGQPPIGEWVYEDCIRNDFSHRLRGEGHIVRFYINKTNICKHKLNHIHHHYSTYQYQMTSTFISAYSIQQGLLILISAIIMSNKFLFILKP